MSNRTAKFASAVVAGALAGVSFIAVSSSTVRAQDTQDSCLSAPKGVAPGGSHWYYRLDHATKRHCWYLRDAKQARATPQDTAIAADAAPSQEDTPSPQVDATTPRSIADAHAELQPQQAPAQPRTNAATGAQPAAMAVDPAAPPVSAPPANAQPAPTPDANAAPSVVGSRWLDPAGTASSAGSQQLASASVSDTTVPSNPPPVIASSPAPAATAVPLAVADASSAPLFSPVQTMLLIVIGAVAFAGLAGSVIVRFGSASARSHAQGGRRDIWDAYDQLPQRPVFPAAAARRPNIGIPKEIQDELREASRDDGHATDNSDDRIAQMLSQLARSARA